MAQLPLGWRASSGRRKLLTKAQVAGHGILVELHACRATTGRLPVSEGFSDRLPCLPTCFCSACVQFYKDSMTCDLCLGKKAKKWAPQFLQEEQGSAVATWLGSVFWQTCSKSDAGATPGDTVSLGFIVGFLVLGVQPHDSFNFSAAACEGAVASVVAYAMVQRELTSKP